MNMKKKSLVAGLLAVSLAAQPVAATIAPRVAQAAEVTDKDVAAAKAEYDKAVQAVETANKALIEGKKEYDAKLVDLKKDLADAESEFNKLDKELKVLKGNIEKAETIKATREKEKNAADKLVVDAQALKTKALAELEEVTKIGNQEAIEKAKEKLNNASIAESEAIAEQKVAQENLTAAETNLNAAKEVLSKSELPGAVEKAEKAVKAANEAMEEAAKELNALKKDLASAQKYEEETKKAYYKLLAELQEAADNNIKTTDGFNKALDRLVSDYKGNMGVLSKNIIDQVARLNRVFPQLKDLEQELVKKNENFEIYTKIVKEYNEIVEADEKLTKEVLDWRKELDGAVSITALSDAKVTDLINEYISFVDSQKALALKQIEDGKFTSLDDHVATKRFVDLKDAKRVIIKKENDKLAIEKPLDELVARVDSYQDKKNELYKLLGRDAYLNESFYKVAKVLKEVAEATGERYVSKVDALNLKTATKAELESIVKEYDDFSKYVKDEGTRLVYEGFDPVEFKGLNKDLLNGVKATLTVVTDEVAAYEKRITDLFASANPSKHEGAAILNDYYKLRPQVKDSVDKDLITKLIKLVDGVIEEPGTPEKPEAYKTYYSRGVNIRNLDGKYLGYLTAGTSINGFVNEKGLIQFKHGDVEATVYPKFVTTDENNTYYAIDGTNVRSKAGLGGEVISYLEKGQAFQGRVVPNTNFLRVEVNGVTGYVAIKRASVKPVALSYTSVGAVIRDADEARLGYLDKGTKIDGVREGNKVRFNYKGQVAYVHVLFVK